MTAYRIGQGLGLVAMALPVLLLLVLNKFEDQRALLGAACLVPVLYVVSAGGGKR